MINTLLDLVHYEMEYDLFDRDPGDIRYGYAEKNNGAQLEHFDLEHVDYANQTVDVVIGDDTYRIHVEKLD